MQTEKQNKGVLFLFVYGTALLNVCLKKESKAVGLDYLKRKPKSLERRDVSPRHCIGDKTPRKKH